MCDQTAMLRKIIDLPGKDYPVYIESMCDQDRIQCYHSHLAVS